MRRSIKHIDELMKLVDAPSLDWWEKFSGSDDFIFSLDLPMDESIRDNLIDILGEETLIFKLEEEVLKCI